MLSIVGKNMRLFRIKYNIPVNEILKKTGLTQNTIYKIERGELFGKSLIKYLFFLKNKNANLNKIFEVESADDFIK